MVWLWDARTGRPRGEPLIGHQGGVNAVTLGEIDGEPVVVFGSSDKTVRLWDARTGRPHGEPLEGHRGRVFAVALGEVGGESVVVSGGEDETVRLWNAHLLRTVPLRSSVTCLAMGKNSVAVGADYGLMMLDF